MADDQLQTQFSTFWIQETQNRLPEAANSNMGSPASQRGRSSLLNSPYPQSRPGSASRSPTPSGTLYRSSEYPMRMQCFACYYQRSSAAGPLPADVELCQRLLESPLNSPALSNACLSPPAVNDFLKMLGEHSAMRVMIELHPFLFPSAYSLKQIAQSSTERELYGQLEDTFNDSWLFCQPILGPQPQPAHARGLSFNSLTNTEMATYFLHQSSYGTATKCLFPYVTAEVNGGSKSRTEAQNQNMHSMCIAMKCLLQLAADAGQRQHFMRRILAFSIVHDTVRLEITAHYPDIDGEGVIAFYEHKVLEINIPDDPLRCQRFVRNLDSLFAPLHIERIKNMLNKVNELETAAMETEA